MTTANWTTRLSSSSMHKGVGTNTVIPLPTQYTHVRTVLKARINTSESKKIAGTGGAKKQLDLSLTKTGARERARLRHLW